MAEWYKKWMFSRMLRETLSARYFPLSGGEKKKSSSQLKSDHTPLSVNFLSRVHLDTPTHCSDRNSSVSSAKKSIIIAWTVQILLLKTVIAPVPHFTSCVTIITLCMLMWLASNYSTWCLSPCLFLFTFESSESRALITTWKVLTKYLNICWMNKWLFVFLNKQSNPLPLKLLLNALSD